MHVRTGGLACIALAVGCASTLSERASMIQWADQPQQVAGCRHLGIVDGSSSQTGPANISTGRNNARNEVLENAAKRGATHIHWMSNDESFMAIHMTAEAFDCTARDRTVTNANNEDGNKSERVPVARDRVTVEHSGEAREPGTQDAAASVPNEKKSASPTISTGTCFFASSSGLALSSLHVVKGHPKIIIVDARGKRSSANVLAADDQLDLVALQVDLESVPQALALSTKEASLGDAVFTIGFPEVVDLGFDPKLTEGSISGERGLGLDFLLQVSTPVQPGNSGGALINESGDVVGIVALRQNFFSDGSTAVNTAFAVKAANIRKAFRSLALSSIKPVKARKEAIERARNAACLVIASDEDLPGLRQ